MNRKQSDILFSMNITDQGFTSEQNITIQSNNWFDAGYKYGTVMKPFTKQILKNHKKKFSGSYVQALQDAKKFLYNTEYLSKQHLFDIEGSNVLEEYLDMLRGFCKGSNISLDEGTFLQIDSVHGCQSTIIQDRATKQITFLHTEENFIDKNLPRIYQLLEIHKLQDNNIKRENLYRYALVTMIIAGRKYQFFGYPGLCFGGPAMGLNISTETFMCVDSLGSTKHYGDNALWVNAIASILFRIGDTKLIYEIVKRLQRQHMRYTESYAVHIVQNIGKHISSFEFGGSFTKVNSPLQLSDRSIITHANFPQSLALRRIDQLTPPEHGKPWNIYNAQLYLEMYYRKKRMSKIASSILLPTNSFDAFKTLTHEMHSHPGDIETDILHPKNKILTGFLSSCLTGYALGFFGTNEQSVHFGKLVPSYPNNPISPLWHKRDNYSPDTKDLLVLAKKRVASHNSR